jgi:predicted alpha/beta-hydrolase family hydrolase
MAASSDESLTIAVADACRVSGLLRLPSPPRALLLLAPGAGAGMRHAFLASLAAELAARDIGTLRYQFPYMERGSRRPDPPELCHATVRAAVASAAQLAPAVPLFAGGKSFGGRMTSQAQADAPLARVRGLAFLGFPLHPPGRPAETRGQHLFRVQIPMLFLQGTRDEFAEPGLLEPLVSRLGERVTLRLFDAADHSFHVPARTGRKAADVMRELVDTLAEWIDPLTQERT